MREERGGGNGVLVRGVYALDLLARLGGDKLVVDEEADGLDVFAAVGRGEGDGEVGHGGKVPLLRVRFNGWKLSTEIQVHDNRSPLALPHIALLPYLQPRPSP